MAQSGGSGNTGVSLGLTTSSHDTDSEVDNLPSSGESRTQGVPPQSGSTGASWVNVPAEERTTRGQTSDVARQGLGGSGVGGSSLGSSDPYGNPSLKSKARAKSQDHMSLDSQFFGEPRQAISKQQIRCRCFDHPILWAVMNQERWWLSIPSKLLLCDSVVAPF